jgi:hypothetical protein
MRGVISSRLAASVIRMTRILQVVVRNGYPGVHSAAVLP